MLECRVGGKYYHPPVPLDGLSRAFRASPHHEAALRLKLNLLARTFVSGRLLGAAEFKRLALDFLVFGNGYVEQLPNRLGQTARYERRMAKYMRVGIEAGRYFQIKSWNEDYEFEAGRVAHVMMPCLDQEIYGVPEYLAALQAAFLNENATLFRRKYYLNGSHAGYILHLDGDFDEASIDDVRESLKQSRGLGNFRNMLLVSQGGQVGEGRGREKVKLLPLSEVAAKDEFLGIKNTTRDDVLAAHRVPGELMGVPQPSGTAAADRDKIVANFVDTEIAPLQSALEELNDVAGADLIAFRPWEEVATRAAAFGMRVAGHDPAVAAAGTGES